MRNEVPSSPLFPILDLGDIKWHLQGSEVAREGLLLAASHVRDPPRVLFRRELQDVEGKDIRLDLQQRHGFRRSLMSEASATLQTVKIAYISGKRKYSRRHAAPSGRAPLSPRFRRKKCFLSAKPFFYWLEAVFGSISASDLRPWNLIRASSSPLWSPTGERSSEHSFALKVRFFWGGAG